MTTETTVSWRCRVVQRRLGRGLDYLISGGGAPVTDDEIQVIRLDEIRPNPHQPRRVFAAAELDELANSIREHGLLQPVVVRATRVGYELIAGERRFRATQSLGRADIPALVRAATDDQMLELALVENIQREALDPIEAALAYRALIERLGLTQAKAAERVGKSRAAVANTLRLLDLPVELQETVASGALSAGHARALLAVTEPGEQARLAARVAAEGLSVRALEAEVRGPKTTDAPAARTPESKRPELSPHLQDLEDQLRLALGTRVRLFPRGERGRVTIDYFSAAEFESLLERLLG